MQSSEADILEDYGAKADGGMEALAILCDEEPANADLRRRYGVALYRHGLFREAAQQFTYWLKITPGDPTGLLYLARAALRLGLYEHARAAAEAALVDEALARRVARVIDRIDRLAPRETLAVQEPVPPPIPAEPASVAAAKPFERPEPLREAVGHRILDRFDSALDLLAMLRALILRNISFWLATSPMRLLDVGFIMAVLVVFHALLFQFLGRGFPGQISMLAATLSGFMVWSCFLRLRARVNPFGANAPFARNSNLKWILFYGADCLWDLLRIALGSAAVILLGALYLPGPLVEPVMVPNFPLLAAVLVIAASVGVGLGLLLHALEELYPVTSTINHIVVWLMYFSNGIYGAYVQQPDFIAPYLSLNPLLTLTEYGRHAFDPTYPVGDLTLAYPAGFALVAVTLGFGFRSGARRALESA